MKNQRPLYPVMGKTLNEVTEYFVRGSILGQFGMYGITGDDDRAIAAKFNVNKEIERVKKIVESNDKI